MYDSDFSNLLPLRQGRATALNPVGRFPKMDTVYSASELDPEDLRQIPTQFHSESTKKLLSANDSPDLGFTFSVNAYRGCEHGCIYCYARPSHEYWGFSSGLDFESQIIVKNDPHLVLADEFTSPKWVPQAVLLSGNTDPYQPAERIFRNSRRLLEVFWEFKNPVVIITKSHRIVNDLDVLKKLAQDGLVHVIISVTSLDPKLSRKIEPRASSPERRLDAIRELSQEGVSVGVNVAPVIPGLTDEEIPSILKQSEISGAQYANYIVLRLPGSVEGLFLDFLDREFPDRKEKILYRLRSLRNGRLNDPRFESRMKGEGAWADIIKHLFNLGLENSGLKRGKPSLNLSLFRNSSVQIRNQLDLFN